VAAEILDVSPAASYRSEAKVAQKDAPTSAKIPKGTPLSADAPIFIPLSCKLQAKSVFQRASSGDTSKAKDSGSDTSTDTGESGSET